MWRQLESLEHSISRSHRQILLYLWTALGIFLVGYGGLEYYNFQELKRSQKAVDELYDHPLRVSNAAQEALSTVYQSQLLFNGMISANTNVKSTAFFEKLEKVFAKTSDNMLIIHNNILGEKGEILERNASALMIRWHNIGYVMGQSVQIRDWREARRLFYEQEAMAAELEKAFIALNRYARDNATKMVQASRSELEDVRQKTFLRWGFFMFIVTCVFGTIFWKTQEILRNSREVFSKLTRANQLIKASQTILIVWENAPGWPVSYVSSNIEQFGYSEEEVISSEWVYENIIHPECLSRVAQEVEGHLQRNENEYMQFYKIRTHEGDYRWVQDHTQIIRNAQGEVLRFEGVLTDITQFKEMETSLREKDEMMLVQSRHAAMGEMISMIAHQWRQPLSVISMSANNMLLDIEFDDMDAHQFKDHSESILAQTQYLSQTIDDFRNFFKPDKELELCRVNTVVTEILGIIGTSLANNNIMVVKELHAKTAIPTFPKELMQVGINLVKNAKEVLVEEKKPEAAITIKTEEDDGFVYFSVCDNGRGVPPENINKIFEPYFTTKSAKEGTGLGLYMSKTIVEKHLLGTIELTSVPGCTCFEIVLPKVRPDAVSV